MNLLSTSIIVLTGVNFVDTVAHLLQKLRRIQYAFMFKEKNRKQ